MCFARAKGGKDAYQVNSTKHWLQDSGKTKVVLRSDPGPSTVEIVEKVVSKREQSTIPQLAPKGSKGSLGLAENANKRGEAQLRKEQAKLKKRLNVRLTKNELLTPWAVRNCAFILNHVQPGNEGLTVHKRIHGEDYKGAMLNFGEKCQFKERREQGKLEDRWPFGVRVGKTTLDDEHNGKSDSPDRRRGLFA